MRSRTLGYAIVSICLGFFLVASPAYSKDKIRIGFSMALTGIYSQGAVSQMNAYRVWKEKIDEEGGIFVKEFGKKLPVEFVYYDDKSSPETAVKVYEKLITRDKVDLLFTPWGTTIHFAVAPLAEKYRFPMVGSTASSVKLRQIKSRYFWFITSCIPDRQMEALVDLLKHLGVKTAAVIYVQDLFPRENLQFLKPALQKAKIETILIKDYPIGVKDLTTVLAQVKGKNPQALIALCYPADSFLVTGQTKGMGLNPDFLFELVGPSIAAFGKAFGKAAEGIATMGHWSPKGPWPGAKEFEQRYVKKWKMRPDYLDSVLSYVECQIIEEAVEKAGTLDREKIRDVIAGNEFQTINGPIRFTGAENLVTPSMILQYQKGGLEIIWPPGSATAAPLFPKPPWPARQ
ncbi:MAG: amino acid ABC transporter substrate-binding protein [Deltaproteobacteria bacterium]|nr:amino acid ABC transporter substrate-binding protein [Deltaproteobacteria bacterium]MBW1977542.1 amino acid ABC transporter substrate-binding protein [Deltaproteobacteria bacterium]MBW2299504.1 amino acid ABC transporter substrate-binding protein [Deltaproteobacteria bacterium]RLB34921.1 MAG: branched-chain amino acid ABC transporter substrate-binding protein [Deltaproteobacteria bacterium]